jgi:hypothetical protein
VVLAAAPAAAAPRAQRASLHERIAVIDLGGATRPGVDIPRQLATAIVAAGFDPVIGDGVEDALAGRDQERDEVTLAAAMATAARSFGALACGDVVPAARQAIGLAAARQAAGRPVPELPRAWAYVLLCADRDGQRDAAQAAAAQLRGLGGSPDVPAAVWAKYPEIDAIADRALVPLDVDADVAGAAIWIDFQPVGASPVHVELPAGDHVIAAASGSRRGWAAGSATRTQKAVHVPLTEMAGPWADVAQRVAGWNGKLPAPPELAAVLTRVRARVALVRHGDTIEAWGQVGRSEAPHLLGDEDGVAPLAEVGRVLDVIADRVQTWNDHAPDPDRPLLVEDTPRRGRKDAPEKPTPWWVYAAIGGAVVVGATIIIAHESANDRQRLELHYP